MAGGLFADLYEFTMAQSYLRRGMEGEAVFDLHVRGLPPNRGYLVAAGAASLARRLGAFRFDPRDLAHLQGLGFGEPLLTYLRSFRFDGRVEALPEGRVAFPAEPLVQVTAPLPMAQLVETLVLNTVHLETALASKAARCVDAARPPGGRGRSVSLVEFGARRAHGPDAAVASARAAYLAGFDGTSLVAAGRDLGIPCFGTMAHSYVMAHPSERAALEAFAQDFPDGTTLLVDTYDTAQGVEAAADAAERIGARGGRVAAVRLDSGDLATLAPLVRARLDARGLSAVRIFASGNLDEHEIARLVDAGAPLDGFGVGTRLAVSQDAPALDVAYKLASYEGRPVAKASPGKRTLPGRKQVWRRAANGRFTGDVLGLADEEGPADAEPLLRPLDTTADPDALRAARKRFAEEFPRVPSEVRRLRDPQPYPVERSGALRRLDPTARP